MAKKKYFIVIDTETTVSQKVVDFGAVIVDKQGNVMASCAVLIAETFCDREQHALFHDQSSGLWGKRHLPRRYAEYEAMLKDGRRMLANVAAVNRWLAKAVATYNPVATAYNKAFDWGKMRNTGIDCDMFSKSFCMWHAAAARWGTSKKYRQFVLDVVGFNPPTDKGNMSYLTNAEIMARFVLGQPELPDEPHTAYEDAIGYEVPILVELVRNTPVADYMNPPGYDWKKYQVKDWFVAR